MLKEKFKETSYLIASTLKWSALSTIIGILVGLSTTAFVKALDFSIEYVRKNIPYYFVFLPLVLFLLSIFLEKFSKDHESVGTERVIRDIHTKAGKIDPKSILINFFAPIFTIAFGGSSGKEAPVCDVGGGISSVFATLFRFSTTDRKKLVICGVSAGFASVFGTPIAGALFGVEVLYVGSILYDVLLPSFIASIVSFYISSRLGITYFYKPLNFIPDFSNVLLIEIILLGIFFGIISVIFIETNDLFKNLSKSLKLSPHLKALLGGFVIVVLAFIFSSRYLGLGLDVTKDVLEGKSATFYDWFLKILFTSITLNFGGHGGVITPIFFVGATSGSAVAKIFNLNLSLTAALGLVGVLSAMTNTPIASSILALELFGPKVAPYAAIVSIISFLIVGHRSIYPSQILAVTKSSSIEAPIGREVSSLKKLSFKRNLSIRNLKRHR